MRYSSAMSSVRTWLTSYPEWDQGCRPKLTAPFPPARFRANATWVRPPTSPRVVLSPSRMFSDRSWNPPPKEVRGRSGIAGVQVVPVHPGRTQLAHAELSGTTTGLEFAETKAGMGGIGGLAPQRGGRERQDQEGEGKAGGHSEGAFSKRAVPVNTRFGSAKVRHPHTPSK